MNLNTHKTYFLVLATLFIALAAKPLAAEVYKVVDKQILTYPSFKGRIIHGQSFNLNRKSVVLGRRARVLQQTNNAAKERRIHILCFLEIGNHLLKVGYPHKDVKLLYRGVL